MITQKEVKRLFLYENGNLIWRDCTRKTLNGEIAGSVDNKGYISVGFNNKRSSAHRMIFLYHYGYLPKMVDHIDGNPLNNKIENLREADFKSNGSNSKTQSTYKGKAKSSKYKGVSKNKKVFVAMISTNKKHIYLGRFKSEILAALAYNKAAVKYHGKYARLNKITQSSWCQENLHWIHQGHLSHCPKHNH